MLQEVLLLNKINKINLKTPRRLCLRGVFAKRYKIYYDDLCLCAVVAQLVEHVIGNDEVSGSIPDNGSMESKKVKIVVFVPESHADKVREAMGKAGGGILGKYSFCSFSTKGIGRFKPEAGARPAVGEIGKLESVSEERIEITCEASLISSITDAIRSIHPYEEIPIDVYNLN
jgi:hypothetical protein